MNKKWKAPEAAPDRPGSEDRVGPVGGRRGGVHQPTRAKSTRHLTRNCGRHTSNTRVGFCRWWRGKGLRSTWRGREGLLVYSLTCTCAVRPISCSCSLQHFGWAVCWHSRYTRHKFLALMWCWVLLDETVATGGGFMMLPQNHSFAFSWHCSEWVTFFQASLISHRSIPFHARSGIYYTDVEPNWLLYESGES